MPSRVNETTPLPIMNNDCSASGGQSGVQNDPGLEQGFALVVWSSFQLCRDGSTILMCKSGKDGYQLEQPFDSGLAFFSAPRSFGAIGPVLRGCQIDACSCQMPINEIEQLVLR